MTIEHQYIDGKLSIRLGETNVPWVGCKDGKLCSNVNGYGMYIDNIESNSFELLNGFQSLLRKFSFSQEIAVTYEEKQIDEVSYGYLIMQDYNSDNISALKNITLTVLNDTGIGEDAQGFNDFVDTFKSLFGIVEEGKIVIESDPDE